MMLDWQHMGVEIAKLPSAGARVLENMHPTVRRALAIRLRASLCSGGVCWSVNL